MIKNHFIHSLWTRPMANNKNKLEANVYTFALSLAYLKKLGCIVNLHTDTLGAKLLSGLGYDDVYLTANEIPQDINPKIFAYIKSMALQREPLGTVHIDGDVFIKTEECLDRIFNHDCDCVFQSCEVYLPWVGNCRSFMMPFLSEHLLSTGKMLHIYDYDFNVGVIGFFNSELKDSYIQNYQNLALALSKYKYLNLIDFNDRRPNSFTIPDLVLEQHLICNLTETSKVRFVLPVDSNNYVKQRDLVAKEIGFTHLLSASKYQPDIIEKVKNRLKEIDSDCFDKVCENIKDVLYNPKILNFKNIISNHGLINIFKS